MKKTLLLFSAILLLASKVRAQDYELPDYIQLKAASDYKGYQDNILQCVQWLKNTPVNEQVEKRKRASAFMIQWINGSPNVYVMLTEAITNEFGEKNPDLLVLYMGGYTQYLLEHPGDTSAVHANFAALNTVLDAYKAGNGYRRVRSMDRLVMMQADKTLEAWAREQFEKGTGRKP